MSALTLGDLVMEFSGTTLAVSHRNHPSELVRLDADSIARLRKYVQSLEPLETQRREAFRVPLEGLSELAVALVINGKDVPVVPLDISITGVYVKARATSKLDLAYDDSLDVKLQYEQETLTYRGVVRRCEPNGIGLFFPESLKGEQINPPPELSRIIMDLQRKAMVGRA